MNCFIFYNHNIPSGFTCIIPNRTNHVLPLEILFLTIIPKGCYYYRKYNRKEIPKSRRDDIIISSLRDLRSMNYFIFYNNNIPSGFTCNIPNRTNHVLPLEILFLTIIPKGCYYYRKYNRKEIPKSRRDDIIISSLRDLRSMNYFIFYNHNIPSGFTCNI